MRAGILFQLMLLAVMLVALTMPEPVMSKAAALPTVSPKSGATTAVSKKKATGVTSKKKKTATKKKVKKPTVKKTSKKTKARVTKRPASSKKTSKSKTSKKTKKPSTGKSKTPTPTSIKPGRITTKSKVNKKTLKRWIGPLKEPTSKEACYRKTQRTSPCPPGYNKDKTGTCWAQCPLEYPVQCGVECLPQNADCTKEIVGKVTKVATTAVNLATSGVFGQLEKASRAVKTGVKCASALLSVTNTMVGYVEELENGKKVAKKTDEVMFLMQKTDFATLDLPIAVATCMGKSAPEGLKKTKAIVDKAKAVVKKLLDARAQGKNILNPAVFIDIVGDLFTGKPVARLTAADKKMVMKLDASCGMKVKVVIDKVKAMVTRYKTKDPKITVEKLRLGIMGSDIMLKDLPDAVSSCFSAKLPNAFKYRDQVLRAAHVVVDEIIDMSEKGKTPRTKTQYAAAVASIGLDAIATFDPTGLAKMFKAFVQPICGPTLLVGDIEAGPAKDALGLLTMQKAFAGSTGEWKTSGNGHVMFTIKSKDTSDITLNVMSGGIAVDRIKVKAGETVRWGKTLAVLGGKTLYLDRWRPGLVNVPGTGGGSLLLWVPNQKTGSLVVDVVINPTSFKDHRLRH